MPQFRALPFFVWIGLGLASALLQPMTAAFADTSKPNIIIIMTDDMGYSDLGCYGSEIETPNLDRLATHGIRFSQFYNTGRCCPTRASLMTGLYAHQAGVGGMMTDMGPGNPGYRGRLNEQSITIAEALGPAGYRCIQTGKWHLGDKKKTWWPLGRGFDRFYGCPQGGGFYFRPSAFEQERMVVRGNETLYSPKRDPPKSWYATDAYTEEGLKYVHEAIESKKPFFWYLAYNAPHFPLKAKPGDIAKYRGRYKVGWDRIRQQRYRKLVKLGLIDGASKLSPRDKSVPAWDTLSEEEKDEQDLRMATYAAMIDCVDQNVGKIINRLREWNEYENTLILFLHDNGGCSAGGSKGRNSGKGVCGTAESFAYYGACWANVSDAPFRKYKTWVHEGGIATPLIAHWPRGIDVAMNGKIATQPAHVIDIMATCADVADATYPKTFQGHEIIPMEGESLLPILRGQTFDRGTPLFFEHQGNRGLRDGSWKLVAAKNGKWELYDLKSDRTEMIDLAAQMPEKAKEMAAMYDAWAERCFVNKLTVRN